MHCIFAILYEPTKIYNIKLNLQSDYICYKHLGLSLSISVLCKEVFSPLRVLVNALKNI